MPHTLLIISIFFLIFMQTKKKHLYSLNYHVGFSKYMKFHKNLCQTHVYNKCMPGYKQNFVPWHTLLCNSCQVWGMPRSHTCISMSLQQVLMNVEEKVVVIHHGRCNNKVYYRLSRDVVTWDVGRDVSTAYC